MDALTIAALTYFAVMSLLLVGCFAVGHILDQREG